MLVGVVNTARATANPCANGGRSRPDDGGIGGTGLRPHAPDDEGGVGGTGLSGHADTGIIGTITGFGSICVGGTEIHYAADTPVAIDGQPANALQLAVGEVVEVTATGSGAEVDAQTIAVRHVVSGPVTRVDADRNEIEVIGQTVRFVSTTRSADAGADIPAAASAFSPETYVRVSGMRQADGVVVASRVTRVESADQVRLSGPVTQVDAGALVVVGTQVKIEEPVRVSVGDEVQVVGRWDAGALRAAAVEVASRVPFDGRVGRVAIEGYPRVSGAQEVRVGPFQLEVPPAASAGATWPPAPDTCVRVEAVIRDRQVVVERIGVVRDLPVRLPGSGREPAGGHRERPGALDQRDDDPSEFDRPSPGDPSGDGPPMRPGGPDVRGPGRADVSQPPDRGVPPDRPAPPDRPGASGRVDRPDRPAPPPDRPSRPQPPQRPDRGNIPERPVRPERPEMHRGRP